MFETSAYALHSNTFFGDQHPSKTRTTPMVSRGQTMQLPATFCTWVAWLYSYVVIDCTCMTTAPPTLFDAINTWFRCVPDRLNCVFYSRTIFISKRTWLQSNLNQERGGSNIILLSSVLPQHKHWLVFSASMISPVVPSIYTLVPMTRDSP